MILVIAREFYNLNNEGSSYLELKFQSNYDIFIHHIQLLDLSLY